MPIRNLWSLECGEVITAEALLKNIKGCEVYFPFKDVGIDLLVVKGKKPVSIQDWVEAREEKAVSSPDLTHTRTVKEGDSLFED
jgi:hypothetical protein